VLEDARQDRDWSLGQLAQELGVSRRTVSKYEDGMDASVEVAAQLEELFEASLTSPVTVLEDSEPPHEPDDEMPDTPTVDEDDDPVVTVLTRVGYQVHLTERAPFRTVSEEEDEQGQMLTGHSEFTKTAEKRARIMSSVGRVTQTQSVYVVDEARRESVEDTAIIEQEEMEEIEDSGDLRNLIYDRVEEGPA
jgi:putative transcriptional regulator